MNRPPLRVAVFNDSPTMRLAIRAALSRAPDVQVVVERSDGSNAAEVVARSGANAVVMDIVMPGVDGYQATRDIMAHHPTPIVMISSVVDPRDRNIILAALEAGALHLAEPPPPPGAPDYARGCAAFIELLRTVAGAHLERATPTEAPLDPRALPAAPRVANLDAIGIVSSAGGPQALLELMSGMPRRAMPPMLLVQHIAKGFASSFAEWLGKASDYPVEVARQGAHAEAGVLYTAPDDTHLWLARDGRIVLADTAPVHGFRPSGDLLLERLADNFGRRAVGVILSGMGRDGAEGATALHRRGGIVVAQSDPVIDGMPGAAFATGTVKDRLPVARIAGWLCAQSGVQ